MGDVYYLDNAATTKVKSKVIQEVNEGLKIYANPMAKYNFAQKANDKIAESRKIISEIIKCDSSEIYFTSGGSESNSWAIKGIAYQFYSETKLPIHIITTQIEHDSVLNACKDLVDLGIAAVTYLPVASDGTVSINTILENCNEHTKLVSIGWANNEIGTVQSINLIGKAVRSKGILFHTDAVQAYGKLNVDVNNVDLMSVSGHKWGAPKGCGFLYIRKGINIKPLINGGGQENGIRGGTHNVPYIAGLGVASQLAEINKKHNYKHESEYYVKFWESLYKKLPKVKVNGSQVGILPNIINLNFSAYNVRGEMLQAFLSEKGICVSTGSACNSHSGEPSHVLLAIGLSEEEADCSVRFSFSENNKLTEIDDVINTIVDAVNLLGR